MKRNFKNVFKRELFLKLSLLLKKDKAILLSAYKITLNGSESFVLILTMLDNYAD